MTIETLTSKIQSAVINVSADDVTDNTTVAVNSEFEVEVFEAEANTYTKIEAMPIRHLYDFQDEEFIVSGVRQLAINSYNRFN